MPTDFSKYADNALEHAIGIAKKGGYTIILLHVYHIDNTYFLAPFPINFIGDELKHVKDKADLDLDLKCNEIYKKSKEML